MTSWAIAWILAATPASAQPPPPDTLPPPPDTLAADTLAADTLLTDTLAADTLPPDTLPAAADTLAPAADTLAADSVQADSLPPPPPVMPVLHDPAPTGLPHGTWEWNRDELLSAEGQTLWELISRVPGLVAVRSGDFGSAVAVVPVGHGGGGIRVYHDGVEQLPLDGAVPDLAQTTLSALESVRVVRRPGGVDVHLRRRVHSDPRPMSRIEVGTGDLETNMLRATFSFPRAFGGKAALAIERLDTQGGETPGAVTGALFRYSLHRGETAGARFEFRRVAAERDAYTLSPPSVSRSDWTLQGVWAPHRSVLLEGWTTSGSISAADSTANFPFQADSRGQSGARFSVGQGPLWARLAARFNDGRGIAEREVSAEVSALSARWGGASARLSRESWEGESGASRDLNAWFTPLPHVTLFAEGGGGPRSVPYLSPLPPEDPDDPADGTVDDQAQDSDSATAEPSGRFTDRRGTRLGTLVRWRGVELSGARVSVEADSIRPTDLLFDRGGLILAQPARRGWELTGRIPLRPRGLDFVAEVQLWEQADSALAPYFPDHLYRGALSFHQTYRETGNFELWVDLGAQGRSPMRVPLGVLPQDDPEPDGGLTARDMARAYARQDDEDEGPRLVPDRVPFYQSWYFRLQMRILSFHIFATTENLTVRRNNQDVPGRVLPATRSIYGIRWTFWN